MIQLFWGAISAVLGLFYLVIENASGIQDSNASYATVVLWLVLPPVCVVGSMLHYRMRSDGTISYGNSVKIGILTTVWSATFLLIVWIFYVVVIHPGFYTLMQDYAGLKAVAQHHTPERVVAELQAAQQIFSSPNFTIVSALVPFVAGTITALVAAFGIKKG